ncbi:MAG: LON peptidase substrate-binding domain-containing protein [Saprospiraceae bacterium]|nr:LON peptidase substrate-binding domain-containing protein [Saprospiraceae bacterium]MBK7467532.1 LON peptidase substrate-binding domain-containing protein [Saprospiraceae bacterium]MBK9993252.1 LON peptidase substrate-binding domain-containing protein [Saprospiraceae bacterium]
MHENSYSAIPVFALPIVVFPEEEIRLHIFEERYKELILDCDNYGISFCICTVIENQLQNIGTIVRLKSIEKRYFDGKMDVILESIGICKIIQYISVTANKLYSSILYENIEFDRIFNAEKIHIIHKKFEELCYINNIKPYHQVSWDDFLSYRIGHFVGFSLQQEFDLLTVLPENERLQILDIQITKMIQITKKRTEWIHRLSLNGEFRQFT